MCTVFKWKKLRSWNVANPDGSMENYTLSENEMTGDYQIKNDFGNIVIDMERMSGYEFLKRVVEEIESTMIGNDVHDESWLDSVIDDSNDNLDCDYTD